jgi:hypothetical protein
VVEVGFTVCPVDWARELKRRGPPCRDREFPTQEGCVTPFVAENGSMFMVVTFSKALRSRSLVERVSLAAHEATHVWQFIVQHIGEDTVGWEIEACSIQWITHWLLEQLEAVGWLKR